MMENMATEVKVGDRIEFKNSGHLNETYEGVFKGLRKQTFGNDFILQLEFDGAWQKSLLVFNLQRIKEFNEGKFFVKLDDNGFKLYRYDSAKHEKEQLNMPQQNLIN